MVYLRLTAPAKTFLLNFQQAFSIRYFDKPADTQALQQLHNAFIPMKLLREYVQIWNEEKAEQKVEVLSLFSPEEMFFTREFELLQTEAAMSVEDKERREYLLNRSRERQYQKSLRTPQKNGLFAGENVKDMEKSMSFGISFIFTLFLSGLSGFYFGKFIMDWPDIYSLMLSLFVTIVTLLMEIVLFIIKTDRSNEREQQKKREEQRERDGKRGGKRVGEIEGKAKKE